MITTYTDNLTPSSSGASRSQAGITKTGNQYARRFLIETAWQHRTAYHPGASPRLQARWAAAGPLLAHRGDEANRRLHAQWVKYDERGKKPAIANTAVARELSGFCWSLAMMT